MKVRYTEAFYSIQGEGRFTGVPSVFLRMYGCNFTCPKFGIARDVDAPVNVEVTQIVREATKIFPEKYDSIDKLPLALTGCDSYAAWHPALKHLQTDTDINGLVDVLLDLTPTGRWTLDNGQDIHLVITGGEPLLGWQRAYIELFNNPKMKDLKNVTFETRDLDSYIHFAPWFNNDTKKHYEKLVDAGLFDAVDWTKSSSEQFSEISYKYVNIDYFNQRKTELIVEMMVEKAESIRDV